MTKVKQLIAGRTHSLWFVSPHDTVLKALQVLAEAQVGALVVLDQGRLAGIISERDYARKVALRGKTSLDTTVADIMVTEVVSVSPQHSVDQCMALMSDKRIRHLPVVEGESVIGMVSIGDLVKNIVESQKSTIEQLEQYIRG
jgi:CBS domain-containing protein